MRPRNIDTANLTTPQLKFTINVLGAMLDKLIQDDMDLNEEGEPMPTKQQTNPTIRQAMQILNYE